MHEERRAADAGEPPHRIEGAEGAEHALGCGLHVGGGDLGESEVDVGRWSARSRKNGMKVLSWCRSRVSGSRAWNGGDSSMACLAASSSGVRREAISRPNACISSGHQRRGGVEQDDRRGRLGMRAGVQGGEDRAGGVADQVDPVDAERARGVRPGPRRRRRRRPSPGRPAASRRCRAGRSRSAGTRRPSGPGRACTSHRDRSRRGPRSPGCRRRRSCTRPRCRRRGWMWMSAFMAASFR